MIDHGIRNVPGLIEANLSDLRWLLDLGERESAAKTLCKRKGVCASILTVHKLIGSPPEIRHVHDMYNGPLHDDPLRCTGEVGKCGCLHSEPKAALFIAGHSGCQNAPVIVATTYSPCIPCAHVIAETDRVIAWVWKHFAPHHPDAPDFLGSANIYYREIR